MHFAKSLLLGASCLFALAQAQSDNLAFTKVPASVSAGEPTTLEWSGGDNSVSSAGVREPWTFFLQLSIRQSPLP